PKLNWPQMPHIGQFAFWDDRPPPECRLTKKHKLRNNCAWAHRCIGTLSHPIKSCRDRNDPSERRQRPSTSSTTDGSNASRAGNHEPSACCDSSTKLSLPSATRR